MITREQVADLQPGDVVELRGPSGLTVCGPLTTYGEGSLVFGPNVNTGAWTVRTRMGDPGGLFVGWTLTVVSRAPRPLYVNHDRTEPVPGDVVSQGDLLKDPGDVFVWYSTGWLAPGQPEPIQPDSLRPPLRLLVDGETGRCVP